MTFLSAPGDTWGISGPDFLNAYLAAGLVFLVAAVGLRLSTAVAGPDHLVRQPSRGEVAYLTGGPRQAVYASLAGLRAAGAVGLADQGALVQTGPAPAGLNPLDQAVHDAAARGVRVVDLHTDRRVKSAVDELTAIVDRAGWLVSDAARTRARLGGLLLFALAAFGVVRIAAGVTNDRPVGWLVLATIVVGILGFVFRRVPRLTRAARTVLAQTAQANRHLAPNQSPAWATYGPNGAAMGVALYGTTALWAADPTFAQEAGIRRESTPYGSASSGSSGGDSGGGGSSCGGGGDGGGGCGGGGCGGGGCGG